MKLSGRVIVDLGVEFYDTFYSLYNCAADMAEIHGDDVAGDWITDVVSRDPKLFLKTNVSAPYIKSAK